MNMIRTTTATDRHRPRNHRRLERPARVLMVEDRSNAIRLARWRPFLNGGRDDQAPLAVRGVPTASDAIRARRPSVFWPATIFPQGFRRQVLAHCGLDVDPASDASQANPSVRALHASVLNVQGRYRTTIRLYGQHSSPGTQLHYEVARAVYQLDPGNPQAVRVFMNLASLGPTRPWEALNGHSRMIAHVVRQTKDLEACQVWIRDALDTARRALHIDDSFGSVLGGSRVHRAAALWAARSLDLEATAEHLQVAEALNQRLTHLGDGELAHIVQLQDERLIYEASSKAFVATGQCLTGRAQDDVVRRLLEIDPCDPYIRLICGDATWAMELDDEAIEHYEQAAALGTLVGANAASRLAAIWRWVGDEPRSRFWLLETDRLDPGFSGGPDDWRVA